MDELSGNEDLNLELAKTDPNYAVAIDQEMALFSDVALRLRLLHAELDAAGLPADAITGIVINYAREFLTPIWPDDGFEWTEGETECE